MNSTALGATAKKEGKIIFISDAHEKFYYEKLKEVRYQDVYHKALCYCLGICNDTRENVYIMDDLGCAKATCVKVIAELDSKRGIGLIEKKRQGLGKPDIIYVKNFVAIEPTEQAKIEEENPANTDSSTEVQNLNFKKYNNQTSRSSEIELQEVQKSDFQKSNNRTSRGSGIER